VAALSGGGFALTGEASPEQVPGAQVSAQFFSVVGVYPDEHSQRFIAVYDDWQKAVRIKQERDGQSAATPALPPGGIVPTPAGNDHEAPPVHQEPPTEPGHGDPSHGDGGHGDDGSGDGQDDGDH